MSRHISDLQTLLGQLAVEHRKLLDQLDAQHAAMKSFNVPVMAELMARQEAIRLRINDLEGKRRGVMRLITATLKLPQEPRLTRLAELYPQQGPVLLAKRQELRDVAEKISVRSQGSGRLASAVLGHLNTVVRLLAGAAERAGLYTKHGIPRVGTRIGVMDAVG